MVADEAGLKLSGDLQTANAGPIKVATTAEKDKGWHLYFSSMSERFLT